MSRDQSVILESTHGQTLQRAPSLATQAYQRLKMQFMLGEMQPGRRLKYREVANELGISVTPAREALFKLVAERIFNFGATGTIVVPELGESACLQLWDIRLLLEAHCAELAVQHATPALIRDLERAHKLMVQAKQARRLRDGMQQNLMFHFLLYRHARSPILLSLIEDVWARSAAYVRFFHSYHVEKRNDSAAQGPHMHSTIISALRSKDIRRVKNGIERDLLEVRDGILKLLQTDEIRADHQSSMKRPTKKRHLDARPKKRRVLGMRIQARHKLL